MTHRAGRIARAGADGIRGRPRRRSAPPPTWRPWPSRWPRSPSASPWASAGSADRASCSSHRQDRERRSGQAANRRPKRPATGMACYQRLRGQHRGCWCSTPTTQRSSTSGIGAGCSSPSTGLRPERACRHRRRDLLSLSSTLLVTTIYALAFRADVGVGGIQMSSFHKSSHIDRPDPRSPARSPPGSRNPGRCQLVPLHQSTSSTRRRRHVASTDIGET